MVQTPTQRDEEVWQLRARIAQLEQENADLKQRLEKLTQSEQRYRELFKEGMEGFHYVEFDPPYSVHLPIEEQCELFCRNLRVLEVNSAFTAMYGVDHAEELVGSTIADFHLANSEVNQAFVRTIVENGYRARNIETEEIDRQGRRHYFLNSGFITVKDDYVVGGWGTQIDITELRETQQALLLVEQKRVTQLEARNRLLESRDHILEATTSAVNVLLTIEDFDQAINTVLRIIGECLDTDRVCIIENFEKPSEPSLWWKILYEWNSPGTIPQISHPTLAQGSYEAIQEWYELCSQGQNISCLLKDMPEPFRSEQAEIDVKALHIVPIFVEGKFWGVVGFDDCREVKDRNPAELAVLKIAAACIGSAIQRERLRDTALQIQQHSLQTEQQRTAELAAANEELRQRDRLLSVVAQLTKNLLETEDVETAIPTALQSVGEAAQMSRVLLILEHQDLATQTLKHCVAYEWVTEGLFDHAAVGMSTMDNADFQVLIQPLHQGRSIWRVIDDLPQVTRSQFEKLEIKSTGVVPIFIEGQYIGCVAFDDCVTPRQWSQQEIDVLTAAADSIGAALHRKQLVDRLIAERARTVEERAAELALANQALRRSVSHLTMTDSLQTFLSAVLQEATQASGAISAAVFVYQPASHTLQMTALVMQGEIIDIATDPCAAVWRSPVPADITNAWQIMSKEQGMLWIDNENPPPEHWAISQPWHRQFGHKSIATIPLLVGERTLGFLGLCFADYQQFGNSRIEQCWTLAQHAALALRMAQLAEEAKQTAIAQEQEQAALAQAAEFAKANTAMRRSIDRLARDPNLNAFLGHVLQEIAYQFDADAAQIFIYDPEDRTLQASVGLIDGEITFSPPYLSKFSVDTWSGWTVMSQLTKPKALNLETEAHLFLPDYLAYHHSRGHRGIVCALLTQGAEPLGFIGFACCHRQGFSENELELVRSLAQQATLAIQMTRLAEEAKQSAVLDERNRMARDIHDTLAQAFTGVIVQLEATKRKISSAQLNAAQEHVFRARNLATAGLSEARRSVRALRPEALDSHELPEALRHLAQQMAGDAEGHVTVRVEGLPHALPVEVEINLLRIGQEALTNALRHAQAQTIRLELLFETNMVHLHIIDDGCGFDSLSELNTGFGLISMQERSQRLDGQFTLTSKVGEGTEITVSVPT